jgi:hypothetical protein
MLLRHLEPFLPLEGRVSARHIDQSSQVKALLLLASASLERRYQYQLAIGQMAIHNTCAVDNAVLLTTITITISAVGEQKTTPSPTHLKRKKSSLPNTPKYGKREHKKKSNDTT